MNKYRLIEQFKKSGYLKIPSLFSNGELNELIDKLTKAQSKLETQSGLNKKGLTFYSNLFHHSTDLQHLIAEKKISETVETVSESNVWVRWDQTITKAPGGHPFPWHRDNAYNRLKVEHYQFWIALTDMNEENGGLWIIPESHNWDKMNHYRKGNHWAVDIDDSNAICINAKPGDALMFSSKMLHKTEVNRSTTNRTAYVIEFMKQQDFDPEVSSPYFFINEGLPDLLNKHPRDLWWKRRFLTLKGKGAKTRKV